ncbi:hypothetical protein M427DRAFT_401502 [Gonapodya prolifera JEL478]|uniref:Uncharacterized protein n=1 Tax=Gonapodya prolifera (strain JEL478) TaxID=1344416 RepID=A0A139AU16_GONPJ|nr:hypothetical protein M427DRAFT_401502 [Gonapodya prolifera JEL478]|eukprot:KXS20073.1 hypothetical protein M427DRAFT_401502 [Gonapodya prolifera JEL478]
MSTEDLNQGSINDVSAVPRSSSTASPRSNADGTMNIPTPSTPSFSLQHNTASDPSEVIRGQSVNVSREDSVGNSGLSTTVTPEVEAVTSHHDLASSAQLVPGSSIATLPSSHYSSTFSYGSTTSFQNDMRARPFTIASNMNGSNISYGPLQHQSCGDHVVPLAQFGLNTINGGVPSFNNSPDRTASSILSAVGMVPAGPPFLMTYTTGA